MFFFVLAWCKSAAAQNTLLTTELLQRHAKGVTLENESRKLNKALASHTAHSYSSTVGFYCIKYSAAVCKALMLQLPRARRHFSMSHFQSRVTSVSTNTYSRILAHVIYVIQIQHIKYLWCITLLQNLRDQARNYALPLSLYPYRAYRHGRVGLKLLYESKSPSQCR